MPKKKLKTLFCGTPEFALPSLEILHYHPDIDLQMIITTPSKPVGRGQQITPPPVAQYAHLHHIPYLQTENINRDSEVTAFLSSNSLDLMIVLAFGQFLNETIINTPRLGSFNIHTSLLPKFRGAAPIQWALFHGEQETGVTIQKIVKKMDAGDVVFRQTTPIHPDETAAHLSTRLKYMAAISLHQFLDQLQKGELESALQDENKVSYAPSLKKEDGHLDFKSLTIQGVKNRLRALDPWPSCYVFLNEKRLKIFQVETFPEHLSPGEVKAHLGMILVGVEDGTLRITELQLEGKKRCSDCELLNGLREKLSFR